MSQADYDVQPNPEIMDYYRQRIMLLKAITLKMEDDLIAIEKFAESVGELKTAKKINELLNTDKK